MNYPLLKNETTYYLRGFGQIMLQESALTGLLFLIGIAVNSRIMFIGALLGSASGYIGARLLRFDSKDINRGLYGYNGALAGLAVFFYLAPSIISIALIIAGGILSAISMRFMLPWAEKLPPYTAPFVGPTWLLLLLASLFSVSLATTAEVQVQSGELFELARGVGQVMFQGNWITGVLFIIGLAIHSRQAAAWACMGSALGLLAARGFGFPEDLAVLGIFGFNASLAGVALASQFRNNAVAPLVGIVISVLITQGFQLISIPPLTAPFVLASWLVIIASWYQKESSADS